MSEQNKQEPVAYTTGHCKEKAQPGGCQLHNLHCGYPDCDRKAVATPPAAPVQEPVAWMNRHGACKTSLFREVEAGAKDEYTIPLYTTPPTAQRLDAVNAQLLEALESLAAADFGAGEWTESAEQAALKARAAIKAAKGGA